MPLSQKWSAMTSKVKRFPIHYRICSLPSRAAVYLVIAAVFEVASGVAAPESPAARSTEPRTASPNGSPAPAGMPYAGPSDSTIDSEPKADHPRGIFGPFRIGPVVGVGLPNLLDFGVTTKLTRY